MDPSTFQRWCAHYNSGNRELPGNQGGNDEPGEEFEVGINCRNQDGQDLRTNKII